MDIMKLAGVDAFVVRDFDGDIPALGVVRSAPKILQSGARELARSQTYQCAVFNMRCQGASAGINSPPDSRPEAIKLFTAEILHLAQSGALMLDAGKGVADDDLAQLADADPRSYAMDRVVADLRNHQHLTGLGAAICADAAVPLEGKSIAIDQFEVNGPAVARAAEARGAKVTAIATSAGAIVRPSGFDTSALGQALAADRADMVATLSEDVLASWEVLGADVDVLFAGSKMGVIDHHRAPSVTADLVVPTGPIPYTTKAALMLERQGTVVLPDFVTTAGAIFAGMPPGDDDQASIEAAVTDLLTTLTTEIVSVDESPILEACYRAEAFLASWRDEIPFGRPFA